jgi:hypothetical protein
MNPAVLILLITFPSVKNMNFMRASLWKLISQCPRLIYLFHKNVLAVQAIDQLMVFIRVYNVALCMCVNIRLALSHRWGKLMALPVTIEGWLNCSDDGTSLQNPVTEPVWFVMEAIHIGTTHPSLYHNWGSHQLPHLWDNVHAQCCTFLKTKRVG